MAPETIFGIVVAIVVAIGLVATLLPKRRPKSQVFKCARCNTAARHNSRTIEAWRNDKTKFYCQTCHSKWLASQPPQAREQFSARSSASGSSGCLGVVALLALLPLGGLLAWVVA